MAEHRLLQRSSVIAGMFVVLGLQALAIHRQSLTMDEPYHLLAGEQAWRTGTNALNLEHPPLVKLVAALPMLGEERPLAAAAVPIEQALTASRAVFRDADTARRWQHRSRWAVLLAFGLPWLLACYGLGREIGGARTGLVLALAMGLSSAVVPFLSLVQTDAGVALGWAVTLLALCAFSRRPDLPRALAIGAAFGLALATKYSAVLLLPTVLLGMLVAPREPPSWRRRLGLLGLALLAAASLLLATYGLANLRYDSERGQASMRAYCRNQGTLVVDDRLAPREEAVLALERRCPEAAQWWLGFEGIRQQNAIGIYPSCAFGEIRSRGRWWYFPAVLAIKTPLPLLAALTLAAVSRVRSREREVEGRSNPARWLFAVSAGCYLAVAMSSNINVGSRHLLPVLPLLLLPAAHWAARDARRLVPLLVALALESMVVAPLWMSATNTWWLGSANPTRFVLGQGDTEYKQNFLSLAVVAEKRGIERLGVLFPATTTEEVVAVIPGGRSVVPGENLEPGWYAVTVLLERAVPAIERSRPEDLHGQASFLELARSWRPVLELLERGEDHGIVAGSFHLVRLP